jgi:hypothetical protein
VGAKVDYARRVRLRSITALAVLFPLLAASSCSKDREGPPPAPSAPASAAPATPPENTDDNVQSVYPLDAGPPDPVVQKLCAALHDLPEQRRATCCEQRPGLVFTGECTRTLTAALRSKAITLDAPEVDRCVAAMGTTFDGCDWVGPWPPETPAACLDIVHGALAAGARCRSSLECKAGLRCQGAGPTSPGLCGAPHAAGEGCGAAVDPLAAFTKQSKLDTAHPECKGYCDRVRCAALIPVGGTCKYGAQCDNGSCNAGKCVAKVIANVGAPCPSGDCEGDARCTAGVCVARKAGGAACTSDFECLGGCLKSDGGKGVCGRRCDVR